MSGCRRLLWRFGCRCFGWRFRSRHFCRRFGGRRLVGAAVAGAQAETTSTRTRHHGKKNRCSDFFIIFSSYKCLDLGNFSLTELIIQCIEY